jgi:hypothetical protein
MAEFRIGQFRYTWVGPWVTGTAYRRDDVISYGGSSFVCIRAHTADTDFYDDLNFIFPGDTAPSPAWVKMTDGIAWRGAYQGGEQYNVGDTVLFGGTVYYCIEGHIGGMSLNDNIAKWEVYASGTRFIGEWAPGVNYGVNAIVRYNGINYKCIEGHTSANETNGLEQDQSKWAVFHNGVEYIGPYAGGVRYRENDLVSYNGTLLRCNTGYTAEETDFDASKWDVEFYGEEFDDEWSENEFYGIGSVVRYGGWLYYAIAPSNAKAPINSIYSSGTLDNVWVPLSKGIRFRGEWSASEFYRTGDVVRRGGNLYTALVDTTDDASTLGYLDESNWEVLATGQSWRKEWNEDVLYLINDLVIFEGSIWQCTLAHTSSDQNYPGDNGSGFDYWDLVIEVAQRQGMRERGDLLSYDLSRRITGDGSTFGPARVAISDPGKILTIDAEDSLFYSDIGQLARTFYVSTDGVDDNDPLRGSVFRPYRTVRFACEKADDGFAGTTTVEVETGLYEEILPIIVPANTVVLGAELRSTTIQAAGPISALSLDRTYTIASLARLSTVVSSILLNQTVEKTTGNPLDTQLAYRETLVPIPFNPPQYQEPYDPENPVELYQGYETVVTQRVSSTEAVSDAQNLIIDIVNYINFHLSNGDTEPVMTGSNIAVSDQHYQDAAVILETNKDFLAEEAVAYMKATFPSYAFDEESCKRDARKYIDALIYDLTYTGNYKSLLAARYYRNAVLGSATEDMFYLRNATGVRNCTLKGLEGVLNPPTAFDLYQRPTGGTYCSLDPGWGPDDTRVWITSRSPYIQGVTNFGTACVGQKIDGALHNGGNKSMVSNDFTQVLDDGIGAWVTNGGRAELVSVFTYYCSIGYFAEEGGIIRATNGNNSYGAYGAIADGVDPTETPKSAVVNNRTSDAIVASTFAGEFNDEIQIFEFENAGINYTQASASIVGAGVGAEVLFEEFRDDAMFEARILDTSTDISQKLGGSGYSIVQNNAQPHLTPGGDLYSITIASNDNNEESDYLGKRLLITGGTGTGQYGIISAYNTSTKVISITKESDGNPGWDHVVSGTPLKPVFDTTTFYRIEPRPVFTAPQFTVTGATLAASTAWTNVVYGETVKTYNNVLIDYDEEAIDPALVNSFVARFNVLKRGRDYSLTLVSPGQGYQPHQELRISGSKVGGIDGANDVIITVLTVTEDSTNPIATFSVTGDGASGVFVTSAMGAFVGGYSTDGVTWPDVFNFPSFGDWKCLAACTERGVSALTGNVRFVAIRSGSNVAASSLDGTTWTARTMPASRTWNDVCYGEGKFVAVAGDGNNFAYSTNGTSWTLGTFPTFGDSSTNEWVSITYGKGKFVAVANSANVSAVSDDGINWTINVMDAVDDSSSANWISVAYGKGRFVAMASQGNIAYSFDGINWAGSTMPTQDGSTMMNWTKMRYGQGLFFAVCDTGGASIGGDVTTGPTTFAATSDDGIHWESRTLSAARNWTAVAFGNPYLEAGDSTVGKNTPMWVAVASGTNLINRIRTGARAIGRVTVSGGVIGQVKIWDPGSGYQDAPELTVIDPNRNQAVSVECRIGDGVLPNPTKVSGGTGYRSITTRVSITGDGHADVIPNGKFVWIDHLPTIPGPGAQITFSTLDQIYTTVAITNISENADGTFLAKFRLSPFIKVRDHLDHGTAVSIREKYSQCRITGHDFLDVGTGNFAETNYPQLYSRLYFSAEENETYEESGGRVFYTSTDQSGNFRTGELFAVEQATGIVTISADFFDFSGLTELRLGGIRLGGTGAVIREFSTDPLFTEDSNNIVPTQRAISAYLANRLSVGGSEIATASFIAGLVLVGPDRIGNTLQGKIILPRRMDFEGPEAGVRGTLMAQGYFLRNIDSL